MINLNDHYTTLWQQSVEQVKKDNFQVDSLIDLKTDNRFGITLLIRPGEEIKNNIRLFLDELKKIEPGQYYYPSTDLHVTVLSIISCYNRFRLEQIEIPAYVQLVKKSIAGQKRFDIHFRGVTLSPSCIMIQGFLFNDTLNVIRDNLRANFKDSDLQQSIDKRYRMQAVHVSCARFRQEVKRKEDYLSLLKNYRDHHFGNYTVQTLELVYTDWYQRKNDIKKLGQFDLD